MGLNQRPSISHPSTMSQELEIYTILITMDIALVAATITAYSVATSFLSFEARLREQARSLEKRVTVGV